MTVKIDGSTGVDKVQPLSIEQEDLKWVPPFTKEYVSPEQTITAGGLLTLAHVLGVAPKLVSLELICKTSEYGFSVGDRLQIRHSLFSSSVSDNFGVMVVPNSTQIRCRYGANGVAAFVEGDFSTGVQIAAGLTNANWRLIVRAWA